MQPPAGGPSLFGGSGRMATSIFDDDDDDDFVKQDRGGVQNLLAGGVPEVRTPKTTTIWQSCDSILNSIIQLYAIFHGKSANWGSLICGNANVLYHVIYDYTIWLFDIAMENPF